MVFLFTVQPASAARTGSATGSIDGQTIDLVIDCSNWGEHAYASVAAADKNTLFEGTRFPDGKFALNWKPADYRYQLLFSNIEPTPGFELANSFTKTVAG
jgi:hypothetical protein